MANDIVNLSVSQIIAGAPSQLQKTGLIVTQGGTTTAAGTVTLIAAQAGLTAILAAPGAPVTDLQAKYNTFIANNAAGRAVYVLELGSGATAGYLVGGVLSGTALLVATWQAITAGAMTISIDGVVKTLTGINFSTGVNTLTDVAAKITTALAASAVCTWNGQSFIITSATTGATSTVSYATVGTGTDIAVLSGLTTGIASAPVPGYAAGIAAGISALQLFIQNNLKKYYAVLLPDGWSADATLKGFVNQYTGLTQQIYFYFTVTAATYGIYAGIKSCFMMVKSAAAPTTESTIAAPFAAVLQYDPSATNQLTPMGFKYLFGVTAYQTTATEAILFKSGNVNFVDTGAEGGISTTICKWGVMADGRDVQYWYAVDWVQINVKLDLANAIINGSNNTQNPLVFDQSGINRLQARGQSTLNRGVSFGVALSPVTVAAQGFADYITQNPSHLALGIYNGLSCTFTPKGGFKSITFALAVSDFFAG